MDNVLTACHDRQVDIEYCPNKHLDFKLSFDGFKLETLNGALNMCNGSSIKITPNFISVINKRKNLMPLPTSFISIMTNQGYLVRFNLTWWNPTNVWVDTNWTKTAAISFNDWWDSSILTTDTNYEHSSRNGKLIMKIPYVSSEMHIHLKYRSNSDPNPMVS